MKEKKKRGNDYSLRGAALMKKEEFFENNSFESIGNDYDKAQKSVANKTYEKYFINIAANFDICIFGGGALGRQISKWLMSFKITPKFFCDNNEALKDTLLEDCISYISFTELKKMKDTVYVIVAVANNVRRHNELINQQLQEFPHVWHNPLGITVYEAQTFDLDKKIFLDGAKRILDGIYFKEPYSLRLYNFLLGLRMQHDVIDYKTRIMDSFYYEKQYIVEELIDYSRIGTYIDCGAFVGDSLDDFIELNTKAEYFLFEMDAEIYQLLLAHIDEKYSTIKERIHTFPYGVGKKKGKVYYISDATGGSVIVDNETGIINKEAEIVSLDEIDFGKKIDFIKMDIEGAEEEALLGCKKIIARDHPVLAISMYHSFSQFVNIPRIIHEMEPRYELYLRHHKHTIDDTVCYAVYK